ncbi:hypothetical protein ACCS53_38440, partial [Rhizobium ruizarguesonis]
DAERVDKHVDIVLAWTSLEIITPEDVRPEHVRQTVMRKIFMARYIGFLALYSVGLAAQSLGRSFRPGSNPDGILHAIIGSGSYSG